MIITKPMMAAMIPKITQTVLAGVVNLGDIAQRINPIAKTAIPIMRSLTETVMPSSAIYVSGCTGDSLDELVIIEIDTEPPFVLSHQDLGSLVYE